MASAADLASSLPRVFDLRAPDVPRVALTLKRRASGELMTRACGGYDPRSISTLAAGADLVLHVKVTDQHTTETPSSQTDEPNRISTSNDVRVMQSFKANSLAPRPDSVVAIVQGGGRIDRGDYIDYHSFNRLPPLNVGDEYVLFVYVGANGTLGIHGSEEGAFRIRNGRVDPLGDGGAASAWKGRSAAKFLDALRARIRP